jgi:hypothetical protein
MVTDAARRVIDSRGVPLLANIVLGPCEELNSALAHRPAVGGAAGHFARTSRNPRSGRGLRYRRHEANKRRQMQTNQTDQTDREPRQGEERF